MLSSDICINKNLTKCAWKEEEKEEDDERKKQEIVWHKSRIIYTFVWETIEGVDRGLKKFNEGFCSSVGKR